MSNCTSSASRRARAKKAAPPEGLHRDGVDWVLVLMVRREEAARAAVSYCCSTLRYTRFDRRTGFTRHARFNRFAGVDWRARLDRHAGF